MKKLLLLFLFCTNFLFVSAQQHLINFTQIRSDGEFPAQLQKLLLEDNEEAQIVKSLITRGRLIYGSELNRYVENVFDNLLEKNTELKKQISIYIVRSPAVNAMIMKQGIVLVNIGLLAQITNESELAFILGHEISHYIENQGKKREKTKITSLNSYLNYHQSSREGELDADKFSLERYFKTSPYSAAALTNVFDVFRYDYLPFDEIPYTRAEVETDFYAFPDNYFLANVKQIRSRADYVDTLSTHPNLQRRQQQLDRFIANNADRGSDFVQSKDDFLKIRDLARFECINFYLTWHDYGNALANIIVLRNQFPDNQFLEIAEAAAYYGFHKHRTNGSIDDIVEPFKDIEGEKQQVCHFLRKLNKKEANVLAIRKLIFALKKYPNNDFLQKMTDDAFYDLKKENNMNLEDFSDFAQDANIDSISANLPEKEVVAETDKYSRIRGKVENQSLVLPNAKFTTANYMLVDLKRDALFNTLYDNALVQIEDEEALAIANANKPLISELDKVIVWQPTYTKINKGKQNTQPAFGNNMLKNAIKSSTKRLKINADIYSNKDIKNLTTEKFNQISSVGLWRTEYSEVDFARMVLYQQANLKRELSDFRYINLVNEGSERANFFGGDKWQFLYRAPLCIITLPLDAVIFALPRRDKTLYFSLYDIENGKITFAQRFNIRGLDTDAHINNMLYKFYYNLRKGRKL